MHAADKAQSAFMAALGPDVKKSIFAGEEYVLKTQEADPKLAALAREMIRSRVWPHVNRCRRQKESNTNLTDEVTQGQLQASEVRIKMNPAAVEPDAGICINTTCAHPVFGWAQSNPLAMVYCSNSTSAFWKDRLRAKPKEPTVPFEDCPDLGPASQTSSLLPFDQQLDLSELKKRKDCKWGAVLIAAAKQIDCQIIFEDFLSYLGESYNPLTYTPQSSNIGNLLCREMDWRQLDTSKVLVGWNRKWPDRHIALAPASMVDTLSKKMNGDGAALIDLLPLLSLTDQQYSDWVTKSECFFRMPLQDLRRSSKLWQLYAFLSPEQSAQAQAKMGEDGLPLSTLDQTAVSASLIELKHHNDGYWQRLPASIREADLTAPDLIASLFLHMQVDDSGLQSGSRIKKSVYTLAIYAVVPEHANQPKTGHLLAYCRMVLPLYSAKREQELMEAGKKASNTSAAK